MSVTVASDRRRSLIDASDDYMAGRIELPRFEEIERTTMPDYASILRGVVAAQLRYQGWLGRVFGGVRGRESRILGPKAFDL